MMATHFVEIITEDYMTRAWCLYEWAMNWLFSGVGREYTCGKGASKRISNRS